MPIVSVHRYVIPSSPSISYLTNGVQYIDNVLTLPSSPDTATVFLGRNVYSSGTYALFDYSGSLAGTPIVGSLSQVSVDISDLVAVGIVSSASALTNDTTNKVITVTLNASSTNGTQYVEGTLTISSPMTIHLAAELYGTPGTYILFSYGSFVGSVSNITIVPPTGRSVDTSVSANGCANDVGNSRITVTLL